jgi:two-component system, chemotaxis family, protein-glutamate methylesterase/glutaminase
MQPGNIIVVGGSAGALSILEKIVKDFPENFPASIFVALHVSPDAPSHLGDIVNRAGSLFAAFAKDEERIVASRIYIAPPDRHLLLYDGTVHLTRDPRENRSRPAIDPLFRSAARWYGPRVIAVLLSGLYDDGVQGLQVVSQHGGTVIVLKPEDTPFPQMPENAIKYDHPDYILSWSEIFPKIQELIADSQHGAEMASNNEVNEHHESASGYVCPDCGGALFENDNFPIPHFRCRIGHAYSLNALLAGEDDLLETALWAAVRALQENAELKDRTAAMLERNGKNSNAARIREDAKAQMEQSSLLRKRIIEVQKRQAEKELAG